jgi:gliding motility-associated-like protein
MKYIFSLILSILFGTVLAQTPCLVTFSATMDGSVVSNQNNNGQLSCGQSYTFCFTVNTWTTTNSNWFDGIGLNFGSGWDISTLTPGPPPPTVGNSNGNWGWYNSVQGTSGANIGQVGPGFFFDLNNDGNPGNDFGDFATVGPWTFCFTISTLPQPNCVNGQNLSISVSTWGDSQVGSWGSPACGNNPVPVYNWSAISCPSAGNGSQIQLCQNSGNIDLFSYINGWDIGGFWTDPIGTPTGNFINPQNSGIWVYSITGTNCPVDQSFVDITIVQQPSAGNDTLISICESNQSYDLNLIGSIGNWLDPIGNPISGILNPPSGGEYIYIVQNPPCPNDTSILNLEIWQLPNPGQSQNLSTCPDGIIDLFSLIGQYSLGGIWTIGGVQSSNLIDTEISVSGVWVYTVSGDSSCVGETLSSQVNLTIFDIPNSDFTSDPIIGCVPLQVQFSLLQPSIGNNVVWNIDGDIINGNSGSYLFQTSGVWEIQNLVTSQDGCQSSDSILISVFDPPSGQFSYSPSSPLFVGDLEVFLQPNETSNLFEYSWTVNGGNLSQTNPWTPPYESGIYTICLVVTDTLGCQGSSCKEIDLYDPLLVWVPNTFTPDGDGVNDKFSPIINQIGVEILEFLIFNRWGEKIYSSNGLLIPWNGAKNNSGTICQDGVYVWKLVVRSGLNGQVKSYIGNVNLIR